MPHEAGRATIFQEFVGRFCPQKVALSKVDAIDDVEESLGVVFPQAYREFLLNQGAVHPSRLLDLVVDQESELWDIQCFLTPDEVAETTELYRSGGMSERLIVFANDSMGNVFCFAEEDLLDARPEDAPVWFFDHDFCEDEKLAETFAGFLAEYLRLA